MGTLEATPAVEIDTYVDVDANAEVVDMTSSLALSGLQVAAFGLGGPETMNNIPLNFVSSNSIEWTQSFAVQNGAKIEVWTSSSTISDIDLYLFYCGSTGAGCSQVAASTTGTANEYVSVIKPADGIWLIGINNWSGPAGTFNLTKKVAYREPTWP
ncbi:MAG: PPC domain-containing protein [Caldilineaceae bacterium]